MTRDQDPLNRADFPSDPYLQPFDRQQDDRFIGNQQRDLIGEPITNNGILFQIYKLRYHYRKHIEPTITVAVEITAGNIALPSFDRTFVEAVGQGNFEDGIMAIARQLLHLTKDEIGDGKKVQHPLYDLHASHQEAKEIERQERDAQRIAELRRSIQNRTGPDQPPA